MKINYLALVMLSLSLLLACEAFEEEEIDNLSEGRIAIIGHGGVGFPSPENERTMNSWEGINKAIFGLGADGIEVDVQISADGKAMLYHDERLQTLTNCGGCVYEYSAEELEDCHYRLELDERLSDASRLVRLERVFDLFAEGERPPWLLLDIKLFSPCPLEVEKSVFLSNFSEELLSLIERYKATDWVIVQTSSLEFIQKLSAGNADLKLMLLISRLDAQILALLKDYSLYGLGSENSRLSAAEISQIHDRGLRVVLWGIGSRSKAVEAIQKSPDFIETDNIVLLQQMLR
ncbi:MAG: glycerophosphodiester phosphodiesterase family protein [Bacteroidota bacterium]